ncbi:MAG: thioesterase family protein [Myxococcota bacterium]
MESFYEPDGDALGATALTRGPWDDRFQHGGPPTALLVRGMRQLTGMGQSTLARIVVAFHRPVPIGRCVVHARTEHAGRTAQRVSAALEVDGVEVLTATGLCIRKAPVEAFTPAEPEWPAPEGLAAFTFPFFRNPVGYHTAVELRVASGAFGTTPVRFWARPRVPLVAGEPTSPVEDAVILADAQSGMGLPLPPDRFTFVNPDLTVAFAREPEKGWMGLDIRSMSGGLGSGLSQSLLSDARGLFGGCSQSLVIAPRH